MNKDVFFIEYTKMIEEVQQLAASLKIEEFQNEIFSFFQWHKNFHQRFICTTEFQHKEILLLELEEKLDEVRYASLKYDTLLLAAI